MNGRVASAKSVEIDPQETLGRGSKHPRLPPAIETKSASGRPMNGVTIFQP
jgi:hypothetical protein